MSRGWMVKEQTNLFPDKSIWNSGLGLANDIPVFKKFSAPRSHLSILILLDHGSDIRMLSSVAKLE